MKIFRSKLDDFQLRLPEEIPVFTTFPRAILIVIIPTTIILFLNYLIILRLDHSSPNRGHEIVKLQWERLADLEQPVEWIIVGDSSALQGVVPRVIENYFGGRVINLSTNAGMILMDDVWMLENYIERFEAPDNVIIIHTYDVWHRSLEPAALAKIPKPITDFIDMSVSPSFSADYVFKAVLSRYFPIFAERQTVIELLLNGISTQAMTAVENITIEGYMRIDDPNQDEVLKDAADHKNFVDANVFEISVENQDALSRLVELSTQYGIDTYLFHGPLYEDLADNYNFQNYFSDLRENLEEASKSGDQFYYIPMQASFHIDQMLNIDHLISNAAEKYSEMIALEIGKVQLSGD